MDIVEAVKNSIHPYCIDWAKRTEPDYFNDRNFCQRNGATTIAVASTLGLTCSEVRPLLTKAVKDGLLFRSDPNAGHVIHWWPVGYLREIKQGKESC